MKQISGCLELGDAVGKGRRERTITKGQEETFESDGDVHYLTSDNFSGIYAGQSSSNCIL